MKDVKIDPIAIESNKFFLLVSEIAAGEMMDLAGSLRICLSVISLIFLITNTGINYR